MTTPRIWLYEQLTTFPGLISLIGGTNPRVFAKKSMTSNQEDHPFVVYKMGFKTNEDLAEVMPGDGHDLAGYGYERYRQFAQVWVHDYSDTKTGDYLRIDQVLEQIKLAVHNKSSPAHGVVLARYIEVSQDLNDETLNTVFKYARIQMITKEI